VNAFLAKLAEILDAPEVRETDALTDFVNWDSLSVLSTIAWIDSQYGVNLSAHDLKDVRTVGDIWAIVQSRTGKS
jgi:acyl carrier protein